MKTSAEQKSLERIGVQVVYYGGLNEEKDRHLEHIAGHVLKPRYANDSGCTVFGRARRDMFWACKDRKQATRLAKLFQRGETRIRIKVCSEAEHWDAKIESIERGIVRQESRKKRK